MKKILVFLITFLGINIFSLVSVNASTYFYEGNYIDGIYLTKEKGGTKYFQKARFFNESNSNNFAYCVEPFAGFYENEGYIGSLTANNLTSEQMDRIKKIAYFGYQYGSHYDYKWYAITQFMIWQVSDPTGDYYFTDTLNGNRITRFEGEIAEINNLINQYNVLPSITNQTFNIVEDEQITLTDTNNVLYNYKSVDTDILIEDNKLKISNLKEGTHTIHLYRKDVQTARIPFFYNSNNSQNMFVLGDLDQIDIHLTINVTKTKLELTKIDSDTKTTTPSGDAVLSGAIYELLDKDMNKLHELIIDEEMKASIDNLKYGTYYLKEIEAGTGYLLDDKIHEFIISKENPIIELSLENKVIEKEVEIHKNYGEENNYKDEEGISFDIIDSNNNLYDTITTNKDGIASITLPYGKYLFNQRNTTYGYTSVDDFYLDIKDQEKEKIELYDYKIKVPNTYIEKNKSDISYLLIMILGLIYVKNMVLR